MRIQKKARKWVLNLWTIALTVLSATGLNPFETMDSPPVQSQIVRDVQTWIDVEPGMEAQCVMDADAVMTPDWKPAQPGH